MKTETPATETNKNTAPAPADPMAEYLKGYLMGRDKARVDAPALAHDDGYAAERKVQTALGLTFAEGIAYDAKGAPAPASVKSVTLSRLARVKLAISGPQ